MAARAHRLQRPYRWATAAIVVFCAPRSLPAQELAEQRPGVGVGQAPQPRKDDESPSRWDRRALVLVQATSGFPGTPPAGYLQARVHYGSLVGVELGASAIASPAYLGLLVLRAPATPGLKLLLAVGGALGAGEYEDFGSGSDGSIHVYEHPKWLLFETGVELRARSGFTFRGALGVGALLTEDFRCRTRSTSMDRTPYPCGNRPEDDTEAYAPAVPYLALGVGYAL
jgi:hypothetical protein